VSGAEVEVKSEGAEPVSGLHVGFHVTSSSFHSVFSSPSGDKLG